MEWPIGDSCNLTPVIQESTIIPEEVESAINSQFPLSLSCLSASPNNRFRPMRRMQVISHLCKRQRPPPVYDSAGCMHGALLSDVASIMMAHLANGEHPRTSGNRVLELSRMRGTKFLLADKKWRPSM